MGASPEAELEDALGDRQVGWFVHAANEALSFLAADFGYRLSAVRVHHEGTYVSYGSGNREVTAEYQADSRNLMLQVVVPRGPDHDAEPRFLAIWDVLAERDPATDWSPPPRNRGLSREAVVDLLQHWVEGLRRLAPDLLRV
jgi:hypothetical protein